MCTSIALLSAGVSTSSRGYDVYVFHYLTSSILLHEGCSLDAAWGFINADRSMKPIVYQHRLLDAPKVRVC